MVSRPCGVVGIAVMLIDVWLFASAFTVNTKSTRKKKTTMRANEEASRVNVHNDASHNRYCCKRPGRRLMKKINRHPTYSKGRVSVSP